MSQSCTTSDLSVVALFTVLNALSKLTTLRLAYRANQYRNEAVVWLRNETLEPLKKHIRTT